MIASFNNGVSLFDPVLSEISVRWFSEQGMVILDPFAGDESRGYVSCFLNRKYIGIELREEQVKLNKERIAEAGLIDNCQYICDTSRNLASHVQDKSVDMIFTCPPYLWLEKYSDDPNDLSNMGVKAFFEAWASILTQSYNALKDDRFAVLVISEVRDKDGEYVGFIPKTYQIMKSLGFHYYNEIILLNNVGTLRLRVGNYMNAGRKIGRMHQNILVFYKGEMTNIKKVFTTLIEKSNG